MRQPLVAAVGQAAPAARSRNIGLGYLLRHTAGFCYGWGGHPVDQLYKKVQPLDRDHTLATMTRAVAEIPLLYQPGTRWVYGINTLSLCASLLILDTPCRKICTVYGRIRGDSYSIVYIFISTLFEMTPAELQAVKDQFASNQVVCEKVVGLFHLFSNKVRFRIACMLLHGEACVQDIADVVAEGKMSNISQQLRMLRMSEVVTKRRDGKQILYSLADPKVGRMIEFLRAEFLESELVS